MKFVPTGLADAYVVELEPHHDDRGFFARMFCADEFAQHGLEPAVVQGNMSFNHRRGTLRGMHFQRPPAAETKYIRCLRGAIYDAIIDLRPESPTYLRSFGVELSADNRLGLYVPAMFGHGYLTLTDDSEVSYLVSEYYTPGVEGGLRYDDPVLDVAWPVPIEVISDKDQAWPPFDPAAAGGDTA
ncbi:MAG TPA: dTDP-4-dehydrorhamnose 3,5-epimerase [Euzebyales bacterium]|nr:dTDP-4-dehydrorhamnose 3,5-epimerase [Euzebyales bacterium]